MISHLTNDMLSKFLLGSKTSRPFQVSSRVGFSNILYQELASRTPSRFQMINPDIYSTINDEAKSGAVANLLSHLFNTWTMYALTPNV